MLYHVFQLPEKGVQVADMEIMAKTLDRIFFILMVLTYGISVLVMQKEYLGF